MFDQIENIDPGNEALKFINRRLQDDQYRGEWSSQHNRFTMEQTISVLTLFNEYAPNRSLMVVRDTDTRRRPCNTPDERIYAKFCNKAEESIGRGTQDTMRKNFFVDFHRMGLITRFDKNKKATHPFSNQHIKYASLTEQGLRLVQEKNILDQYFIFSKGIDNLLGGYIDIILSLLRNADYNLKKIHIHEFMFFVSAINAGTSFNINHNECIALIQSYRNMGRAQEESVILYLKSVLKPENFSGNKTQQRDFHNWLNKAQQMYFLLGQTVYFEIRDNTLILSSKKKTDAQPHVKGKSGGNKPNIRLERSLSEKHQYMEKHEIEKIKGFELHHVVPLSWSESEHQFKLLDAWLNMVYIDGYSHAKITQNNNKNVVMSAEGNDLTLSDYEENRVSLKKDKNIAYKLNKQKDMLKYNGRLLKTVK